MTIQQAIEKAIEGGWKPYPSEYTKPPIEVELTSYDEFFDMGKSENWQDDMIKLVWEESDNGYDAAKGGGEYFVLGYPLHEALLSPSFWQCLGKAMGWEGRRWVSEWVELVYHLADGKDINSYFESLT